MRTSLVFWLSVSLFMVLVADVVQASPLAPAELRVSDTPQWTGEPAEPGSEPIPGVSRHPHFRVRHLSAGSSLPAEELRIQVAPSPEFAEVIWDSGFVGIASTAHLKLTPGIPYNGIVLEYGETYYWRAAVKDSEGTASNFSECVSFQTAEAGLGVDLRIGTGHGTEELQGNPVSVAAWPPSLAAEFVGDEGGLPAVNATVEVAADAHFENIIWRESVEVGELLPGERTGPILYGGEIATDNSLFWRIRFVTADGLDWPWSTATSAFLYSPPDPTVLPPGGFAQTRNVFGGSVGAVSSVTLGDVDGNGATDAVVASSEQDESHALHLDVGTASPGPVIAFGGTEGGPTFGLVEDFNLDKRAEIAVVNQAAVRVYSYEAGSIDLIDDFPIEGGIPIAAQAFDVNFDGWIDVVVAFEYSYLVCYGGKSGFDSYEQVGVDNGPVTDLVVTDFNSRDGLQEVWLLGGNQLQLFRGFGWLDQSWELEGATKLALANGANPALGQLIAAGPENLFRLSVSVSTDGSATVSVDSVTPHGMSGPCIDVVGRELTGDESSDAVVAVGGTVMVWASYGEAFVAHEYVGLRDSASPTNIAIEDTNGDTFPDVVLGRSDAEHEIFLNRQRVGVSISGFHATQYEFGEAYAKFKVELDAAPTSTIEVWCETYEEEPEGGNSGAGNGNSFGNNGGGGGSIGDSDGDPIGDAADFLVAQVSPSKPYVPTRTRLVFARGQTVAWFYVALTRVHVGSQWHLHARIIPSPIGAVTTQGLAFQPVSANPLNPSASAPPSGPGMTRDWRINGVVNDLVESGGNTYFGGDFDGVSWDARSIATLDKHGHRRMSLPPLASGTVWATAMDATGAIYVGGVFTIPGTTQIKNLAKVLPDGSDWDRSFHPNPNGPVYAIDVADTGAIYFGGAFTGLQSLQGTAFYNIAVIDPNGAATAGYSNLYGVTQLPPTGTSPSGNAEVYALKVANCGVQSLGNYLIVGGSGLNYAFRPSQPSTYQTPTDIGNFALFRVGGIAKHNMPKPDGPVRAIAVTNETWGLTLTNTIVFGGHFSYTQFRANVGDPNEDHRNLNTTNFGGEWYNKSPGNYSSSPVNALLLDTGNRLWVGRNNYPASGPSVDPLVTYTVSYGDLQYIPTFGSYLNGPVTGLALGEDDVVAIGNFSQAGAHPAKKLAAYSRSTPHQLNFGFRAAIDQSVKTIASGWSLGASGQPPSFRGFVVGGAFIDIHAERGHLAAMDASGHLLAWGPRADGPVNAMAVWGSGPSIYFGGSFTSVTTYSHKGLAGAPANDDAQSPYLWNADVEQFGAPGVVYSLAVESNRLIVGGDFTHFCGVGRTDVAAINLGGPGGAAYVNAWNPSLVDGAGNNVQAIVVDGDRVYLGGGFAGTTSTTRPGILAIYKPGHASAGQLINWDADLSFPSSITGIAVTNDDVVFVGDFTTVAGQPRSGAAAVDKANALLTSFEPVSNGLFKCVQATSGGLIYLGGKFSTVAENPAAQAEARKGIVSLDAGGTILPWTFDVLVAGSQQSVNVLRLASSKLWVGGDFSGVSIAGQDNITWLATSWYITTPDLPNIGSGQPYPTTTMQLSEQPAGTVTWSVSGPASAWLSIDQSGALSGAAPIVPHTAPPLIHYLDVTASAGSVTVSRQYVIQVNPAAPPKVVAFVNTGPILVQEGDTTRTESWMVELDIPVGQSLSTPVHVLVEHLAGTARPGYEYAAQVNQIVFYPQGQTPPTLPTGTIATSGSTIALPVTIYGDDLYDSVSLRSFTIRLTALTAGSVVHSTRHELVVEIEDLDPVNPAPERARVLGAAAYEDSTTPANPLGVVTNTPHIVWQFGSDFPNEYQGAWEVQVSDDSSFATFDQYAASDSAQSVQLSNPLADGTTYYARVKVWDSTVTNESDWFTFSFHCNTPPANAHHLRIAIDDQGASGPNSTNTSRPTFEWSVDNDAEGSPQHVVVTLEESGGGTIYDLDSRVSTSIFEYRYSATGAWQTVGQAGVLPNPASGTPYTYMRVRLPASMAMLDGTSWQWRVDVVDPFETTVGPYHGPVSVSIAYVIEGVYLDSTGTGIGGRSLNIVHLPSHAPLALTAVSQQPDGDFTFTINQGALSPGDVIAICVDPGPGPITEYASAIFRFTGTHMRGDTGVNRKLTLVKGACLLDGRGLDAFNLSHLKPPALPVNPVAGFPFVETAGVLELTSDHSLLTIDAQLRVRGTYAQPGEPTTLLLSDSLHQLVVAESGVLSVEEGAVLSLQALENNGYLAVHDSATLVCNQDGESAGELLLHEGSLVHLADSVLTVSAGVARLTGTTILGVPGTSGNQATVAHQSGLFVVTDSTFDNTVLLIAESAPDPAISSATFAPGTNPICISWERDLGTPATIRNVLFMAPQVGSVINVQASTGADEVTMVGCGGDYAGETFDDDPGELAAPPVDIVVWQIGAASEFAAHPGDEKVLLVWNAGVQAGSGFSFEVFAASQATGPFSSVGTTPDHFYVHDQLTNGTTYYYYVRTLAWGQQQDSNVVHTTPRDATIQSHSPATVKPTGTVPAAVVGSNTHFDATTFVDSSSTLVTVPGSSVVVLSPTLVLFDVESNSALAGIVAIDVETPSVWSSFGAPGYSELLTFDVEVTPPSLPLRPTVEFTLDNDAVDEDEFTDGSFKVSVEFDANNGAPVEPVSFECVVDRDILVGGNWVPAGTDLAGPGFELWGQPTNTGATWNVDQVYTTTDPQVEHIAPGELVIRVRVANEFGLASSWTSRRIFVNDTTTSTAFALAYLRQGVANQMVTIVGNDLTGADHVVFSDPEINVIDVTPQTSSSSSFLSQTETWLEVELSASAYARIGSGTFEVYNLPNTTTPVATGNYKLLYDSSTEGATVGYPDPLASKSALDVTLQNGAFSWTETDITTTGRAFPIEFDRTYRSDNHARKSPLGYGWNGTYLQYIEIDHVDDLWDDFTWFSPDGGEHRFIQHGNLPMQLPHQGVGYTTPIGLAARADVLSSVNTIHGVSPVEIGIQTAAGLMYVFKANTQRKLSDTKFVWYLDRVEDANRNQHILEYNQYLQLVRIEGDVISEAMGATSATSGTTVRGDSLELSYHSDGQLKEVKRVWRVAEATSNSQSQVKWVRSTDSMQLEAVRYWYESGKRLVLQQQPEGTRYTEKLYKGYRYEQISGGPHLLTGIYPPSRVTNAVEAVPAWYTSSPGSSFDHANQVPDLDLDYAQYSQPATHYRVVQQKELQELGGSPSQHVYRTWNIGYVSFHASNGAAQVVIVNRPDGSKLNFVLTEFGQPTQVIVEDGSKTYTTSYDYYPGTRATLRITQPNNASTFYVYAHSDNASATGSFNNVTDIGNYSKFDLTSFLDDQNNPADLDDYREMLVRLQKNGQEYYRYGVVDPTSDDLTLYVLGNFEQQGWTTGNIQIYYGNSNPLSRYKMIQKRECDGPNETVNDLVTTHTHEDAQLYGRYKSHTPLSVDPRGNVTITTYAEQGDFEKHSDRSSSLTTTIRRYIQRYKGNETTITTMSVVERDKYGRVVYEHDEGATDSAEVFYEYDVGGQTFGSAERLKSVTLRNSGGSTTTPAESYPFEVKTQIKYDLFGNVSSVISPRGLNPAPYSVDDFKTEYKYNGARQLYRVTYPASGPSTNPARPDVWSFYDKDGRLVREVSLLTSSYSTTTTGVIPGGVPQDFDDTQVVDEFKRPLSYKGEGWLHTVYEYNAAGEVVSQATDIDLGSSQTSATTADATTTYDAMGRAVKMVDAGSRVVEHVYDGRGLVVSTTVAGGTAVAATYTYQYDNNGNLIVEQAPGGAAVFTSYDNFNRPTQVLSPTAGGLLKHETTYPKPYEQPNMVKEKWSGIALPGAGSSPVGNIREVWTEYDEFGNPWLTRQLARNSEGRALSTASYVGGKPWATTASKLDQNGMPLETWVEFSDGRSTSSTPGVGDAHLTIEKRQINPMGWLYREEISEVEAEYRYDAAGNVHETLTDYVRHGASVAKRSDKAKFDPANNLWQSIDALGKIVTYTCNNLGWVEKVVDASGRETSIEYDFGGRPVKSVTGTGSSAIITDTLYDKTGLTLRETAYLNGQPQATTYLYDQRGRLVKVGRPDSGETTYVYDDAGRLKTETRKAESVDILHTYDSAGNLTRLETQPAAGGQTPIGAVNEVHEFTYDMYGSILTATTKGLGGQLISVLTMEYNTFGQIDHQVAAIYDDNGQLLTIRCGEHTLKKEELGFRSEYEHATDPFSEYSIRLAHDTMGRETSYEFWDDRKLVTSYVNPATGDLQVSTARVFDSGVLAYKSTSPIIEYEYQNGLLLNRTFSSDQYDEIFHHHADRPGYPGKSVDVVPEPANGQPLLPGKVTFKAPTTTAFNEDKRGMVNAVEHRQANGTYPYVEQFAGVALRYDYSGNPVLERRYHQGGSSRVMQYDFANRMTSSMRGHVLGLNLVQMPDDLLPGTAQKYLDPLGSLPVEHQWRRGFVQDDVDNITRIEDVQRDGSTDKATFSVDQDLKTKGSAVDMRNLIGSRSDAGTFGYDQAGRITDDPLTELEYEHNYRGQITKVTNKVTGDVLRKMSYDAFGRMVHQVDSPDDNMSRRGTIFIPNIGFGGGGRGADFAGEITYSDEFGELKSQEVLQYTYGQGAVAGGIGYKRVLEFIAQCKDYAPYFRFLHEDSMGNTIATTSLFGDRLDLYDYSDYGVPMHYPVALDGRWIAGVAAHGEPHVSVITLVADILDPNELLGCEVRFVRDEPTITGDVYDSATIISQYKTTLFIHDENHTIANGWPHQYMKRLTTVLNMREGVFRGRIDSVVPNQQFTGYGWYNEQCFHVKVTHGAFEGWMRTYSPNSPVNTFQKQELKVRFSEPGQPWQRFTILGTADPVTEGAPPNIVQVAGQETLIVRGTPPTWLDVGDWYGINGNRDKRHITQSGEWASPASGGGTTTFHLEEYAAVTEEMVGWILQPDINHPVFAQITHVDESALQLTVNGDYAGGGGVPNLGDQGTRFRIFAPPGAQTWDQHAGTLSKWVAASSSRCLFGGYRYESPLAGFVNWDIDGTSITKLRQTGKNFAGMHYTLHRHYDPVLMRFTGPDPLSSPFYNRNHYTGNNPARFFDPDGLISFELFSVGDTKIGFSTDGYTKRAKETWVGAAVGGWDALTFGMHLTDEDRIGIAKSYGVDPSSGYFQAGMIVGNLTVSFAVGVASGGLANVSCIGRAASFARVLGNGMKTAMFAGDVIDVAGAVQDMNETGEWSLRQTMALVTVVGNGGGYALGKVFHPKCFVEGTQVLAQDETGQAVPVAIETVEAGDLVWSRCDKTGEEGFKVVVETYIRETDELVHLSYRTEGSRETDTLTGTAEHPFWSLTADDWVDMGDLKVGERLSLTSGEAVVTEVLIEVLAEPVTVYNFQVKDYHTYFAAPDADKTFVWVHNADYGGSLAVSDVKRIDDIRSQLNIGKKRNIAVGEGMIDGRELGEVLGVSGRTTPGVKVSGARRFKTFEVSNFMRDNDAEALVLENIARRITPGSSGTLRLLSERPFCDSCKGVIGQFRAQFPNIKVILRSGREGK